MLTLLSQFDERDCGRTSRRDFLRIGALGLGGLALPSLFAAKARAGTSNAAAKHLVKDKSVILLFLCGGAPQTETFDPKMSAPLEFRSTTGEVKTSLPGVTFGGTFPKLAKLAHKLAVVRSYRPGHEDADHARAIKKFFTVNHPMQASIGAITSRLRGGNYLPTGLPAYASLLQDEVDPQYMEDQTRMAGSDGPGALGPAYAPFTPAGDAQIRRDMKLNVPLERLQDRRALLKSLDRMNRAADASGAMESLDEYEQRAVEVVLGGKTREALDLADEDPRVVERYDTGKFANGHLKKQPCTLGQRLLLARRLCEAGCGFVTVGMAGWDMHGNGNHPGMADGMRLLGGPVDHAVSAFLEDVEARGLSEKILLVITSEFGRSPKIQKQGGGRDHWPALCPLAFAGGGLRMGQVIGQSTPRAEEPNGEPVTLNDLLATILDVQFDTGALRLQAGLPRELLTLMEAGRPIRELL